MRRRTTLKRSAAALGLAAMALAMAPSGTPADAAVGEAPVSRPLYTTEAPIVMLKDLDSGAILFERGADKRFAPASMAKVMTAYVVLDLIASGQLPRDKLFTVSEATWKKWNGSNGGSTMFLRAGEKISVDELLKGLITVSGNDAAAVLAVEIDGSEEAFVRRMNEMAARIGMTSSRFGTPSGWPDGGVTKVSAADLITLADRLIRDHPAGYARYFSIPKLQHGKAPDGTPIVQPNRNPILGRFEGADGLKTGHTAEAGYCFLGSAKRGGRRLIMVVAGMKSEKARRDEAERLMTWGFEAWEGREIVTAGAKVGRLEVGQGDKPVVAAEAAIPVRVTVPKGFAGGFRATMRARAPLKAPVARGSRIAELVVAPDGLPPQVTPLLAANDVAKGGWYDRARTGFYRLTGW
ncbi:D-alanyl-D-alanine carboxypeptidase family protein [Sphingopyxis flava]|uniref:serine-type D-Ala-D-Ala carboxypeptidase n=1 Tax=Sphingopyxis flava TaxID=1507287 RepID=A0A1T5C732_9SPHN|nr:D-alanyl-D-alanine carboxypeptidase family protein [Sphingopyxis flava]SKB55288.1 D-alanyl-D-alanine carboxypeptidase (penicillin-binding protein 5/6) [Sphingopyxis flava]